MKDNKNIPIIAITTGDPNGIGPEIILKAFADPRMFDYCTPLVYISQNILSTYAGLLDVKEPQYEVISNPKQVKAGKLNIFCNWMDEKDFSTEPGVCSDQGGWYAFKSLQAAVFALKNNMAEALVTAPINKYNIQSEEFAFPGHSEYLTKEAEAEEYLMLMVSDELRIGLASVHVALKKVPVICSQENLLRKLRLMHHTLEKDFAISRPNIAVLGLNPHAGENGLIGNEENEILIPAIKQANEENIMALGPFSADGFFGNQMQNNYDATLAIYHDQGLIPFKTLAFGSGVNYTAGLPFIRTSPDHGTAYNLAGQNKADENSFREAIFTAIRIIRNRENYNEMMNNPLQKKIKLEKEDGE